MNNQIETLGVIAEKYVNDFEPHQAMEAINCLMLQVMEGNYCELLAHHTDALKGINELLGQLQEEKMRMLKLKGNAE